ncbi:EamA family transporter [Paenibacillus popilliae]|uniref:Permease n=1 Tax=Paenibacillus popilliae ATCC 14706 TaxID=1212764 RepID=M9M584_PAEPP|nr:EamA family transporter [Paenibacillus popilliae]GAC42508.1 permease [Paenibacillus popilliae ATCC 14706]
MQTWCQQHTSASRVAVIFAMEPVFAAITGVTFAGKTLGLWAMMGCLLILAGMIVVELKWGRHAVQ